MCGFPSPGLKLVCDTHSLPQKHSGFFVESFFLVYVSDCAPRLEFLTVFFACAVGTFSTRLNSPRMTSSRRRMHRPSRPSTVPVFPRTRLNHANRSNDKPGQAWHMFGSEFFKFLQNVCTVRYGLHPTECVRRCWFARKQLSLKIDAKHL